jgi:hypothetical protein
MIGTYPTHEEQKRKIVFEILKAMKFVLMKIKDLLIRRKILNFKVNEKLNLFFFYKLSNHVLAFLNCI